jgi:hypothetical protein
MFIRNYKISEIVNDLDSDGGNCSEISDYMCKVRPVPVVMRSKAWVYGRSPAATMGSSSTGGVDIGLLYVCCHIEVSATS